jgi:hypothetical protein
MHWHAETDDENEYSMGPTFIYVIACCILPLPPGPALLLLLQTLQQMTTYHPAAVSILFQ